jgi:uncharacterized protein
MLIWQMVALGLVGGLFSGAFGVGGGIIMVPAMVLLMHLPQKSAQGMSLAVMVPLALVGAMRYWLKPDMTFDIRLAAILAVFAIIGTLAGTSFAGYVSAGVLRKLFGVVLLAAAAQMFISK